MLGTSQCGQTRACERWIVGVMDSGQFFLLLTTECKSTFGTCAMHSHASTENHTCALVKLIRSGRRAVQCMWRDNRKIIMTVSACARSAKTSSLRSPTTKSHPAQFLPFATPCVRSALRIASDIGEFLPMTNDAIKVALEMSTRN